MEELSRRRLLALVGGAASVPLAGCGSSEQEPDGETTELDAESARELAESYAPTLYFDEREQWFPTDPRPYASSRDGDVVVDGFDALDGYVAEFADPADPPAPTVFYRALEYDDSPLAVVQYWWYSAFDQFATNFHWHDWEVVHVFLDRETGDPQLYVASAHSRTVPNNEFLDPGTATPRVLAELGSHSSALSVNDIPDRFQRVPTRDTSADITNRALEGIEAVADVPAAYGLPRDEGAVLPYVVPELDGRPIHEDARLPNVDRAALVPSDATVRSYDGLASPPSELPARETGLVFGYEGADPETDLDVSYDLLRVTELEDITAFTGPQLSFEFAVPGFVEDAISGHITTTGVPWEQDRYDDPAADISEPAHRSRLADRYDAIAAPGGVNRLVAAVRQTATADDAPDGEGVATTTATVEAVTLLESDPVAVPTFGGVAVVDDPPAGEHRLTVNGAGYAPYSETVTVTDDAGPDLAGVDGQVALSHAEHATKLRVDGDGVDADLRSVTVADDFGGRLYEAPVDGRDAVYVDRRGAYTTEVRDADDEVGAFRANPAPGRRTVTIDRPQTGKASLSNFLASVATETVATVDRTTGSDRGGRPSNPAVQGLTQALESIAEAAQRAAARAEAGDASGADNALRGLRTALSTVRERLSAARGSLPAQTGNATDRRLEEADRRLDQALDADTL